MNKILLMIIAVFSAQTCWSAENEKEKIGSAYAKININTQLSDEPDGSYSEIRDNNSWIGIKGKNSLDDTSYVFYRLEWKVDTTVEKGDDNIKERPQYLGIGGKFGELSLGRNFTALWMAQGFIDLYNHYEGDIAALWKGENRLSDVATYTTPKINKFYGVLSYQAEKSTEGQAAVSAGLFYGDSRFKKHNVFAALAHDFDVNGYDTTRASLHYKMNQQKIGFMLQQQKSTTIENADSETGALASYSYLMNKVDIRVQLQTLEDNQSINLGFDYKLASTTKVYAWIHSRDIENDGDSQYLAFGFEHRLSKDF